MKLMTGNSNLPLAKGIVDYLGRHGYDHVGEIVGALELNGAPAAVSIRGA